MTTILLGPAPALSAALTDHLGDVVVIDGIAASAPDAEDWQRAVAEATWQALVALQNAYVSHPAGTRIVVVLPTIGISGEVGMTALTTAVEGIRALAKSAARQWHSRSTTVNIVAAPTQAFALSPDPDSTLIHSVVEAAKFLLRNDIDRIVGETIVVDGGSVMLP